jgi:hypothetical protein
MTDEVLGGCKCGSVRYKGTPADAPMFRCHCRDCQQLTGTGHSEMMPLVVDTFVVSGVCRIYEMTGGSGQPTYSGFCPNCGSPLTRRSERMNDRICVHAASLDDPSRYIPARSTCPENAQPWDEIIN